MAELALANLTTPMVLFFALGFAAALLRSDLSIPEAVAKGMALYLLLAIGFKGGVGVSEHGLDARIFTALLAGLFLSATLPMIGFAILGAISRLSRIDAAAVAAHYGSISIVTFVAGTSILSQSGIAYEGYMVAVAAAMEAPAIMTALILAGRKSGEAQENGSLWREVLFNGSIVLLVGAFAIGWITGPDGLKEIDAFITAPFKGVLCLFLLDMGLIAGRGLINSGRQLALPVLAFGIIMPLIGATAGLSLGALIGLSVGGTSLLAILSASASYIAVPAALRVALPDANPAISLTLSLGITFPFNLIAGIPLYMAAATFLLE